MSTNFEEKTNLETPENPAEVPENLLKLMNNDSTGIIRTQYETNPRQVRQLFEYCMNWLKEGKKMLNNTIVIEWSRSISEPKQNGFEPEIFIRQEELAGLIYMIIALIPMNERMERLIRENHVLKSQLGTHQQSLDNMTGKRS